MMKHGASYCRYCAYKCPVKEAREGDRGDATREGLNGRFFEMVDNHVWASEREITDAWIADVTRGMERFRQALKMTDVLDEDDNDETED